MNEHQKLKAICDKIGFMWGWPIKIIWNETNKVWERINYKNPWVCDVREIIFTQEFMDKLIDSWQTHVFMWDSRFNPNIIREWLLNHLDNPVEYLYNLFNNEN